MRPLVPAVLMLALLLPAYSWGAVSAYQATTPAQLPRGGQAQGQIGDLVLENGRIIVVISAIGHITQYGENGGTVIDAATQEDRLDALGELYTYFDDDWPRQAVYTGLTILDDGGGGGPAVVRATGHDLDDPGMAVETDYVLQDGDRYLTLTTRVTGGGAIQPDFELGDAFAWGSCSRYAPGYGFAVTGITSQAWLAGKSADVCYAYAGAAGDCWGPHGNGWSDVNVTVETLDPVLPTAYTRYLAVAADDIARAVSVVLEATGAATGGLICNVMSASNGSPLAGALVNVYDGSGNPYVEAIVGGAGQAFADVPPGDWRVVASASGYQPAEVWRTVFEGADEALDFSLFPVASGGEAIGDTLTVIQRPLVNIPAMVRPGDELTIEGSADPAATGWQAALVRGGTTLPLTLDAASYDPTTEWWTLQAVVPVPPLLGLWDLRVTADGGIEDTARDAVQVLDTFRDDFYFIHITDTHLPDHLFSSDGGAPADSTAMVDLRAVIDDINLIHPEFVLITGDLVNEGELEDYLEWRSFTRAQRMLYEFEVPTYLVSGNHDIGGWTTTPPPAGTARRNWWRFFGWPRLDDPPAGAPLHTQNYSFDYGPVHFTGLEAYNNYDLWRDEIYNTDSFIPEQLAWLGQDLAAASSSGAQVLFYHMDFRDQLDLDALGVEVALWGHIHSDRDDFIGPPFNIATESVCDGNRAYRLIRVSGSVLEARPTLSAGPSGGNLSVAFVPSNAGLASTVAATVTNDQPERFENGHLRFVMPAAGGNYRATGGALLQVDESGPFDVCEVAVDIPASGSVAVTVEPKVNPVPEFGPGRLYLAQNHPNPFNPATTLAFEIPGHGPARLTVFDPQGHLVAVLVDRVLEAGRHEVRWDGRDGTGRPLASGLFIVRLETPAGTMVRKITLAR